MLSFSHLVRYDYLSPADLHGHPRYAKLSFNNFERVKIAAIYPDFMQRLSQVQLLTV